MFDDISNLFQIFADEGYHITGRSERAEVFRFLDYESFITPVDPKAKAQQLGSMEDMIHHLKQPEETPQFCFPALLVYTRWIRDEWHSGSTESRIPCEQGKNR